LGLTDNGDHFCEFGAEVLFEFGGGLVEVVVMFLEFGKFFLYFGQGLFEEVESVAVELPLARKGVV
jgi:hypothetical protein